MRGIAAALAFGTAGVALGVAGAFAGLWLGWTPTAPDPVGTLAAGLALNALCHMQADTSFGVTAAIGLGAGAVLVVAGLLERPPHVQRVAIKVVVGAGVFAALAGVGLFVAGRSATADVALGREYVETGIDELRDGEYDAAASSFATAGEYFTTVESAMDRPWAQLARFVPIASQHRRAADVLGQQAAEASESLSDAALVIDPDALRLVEGRLDLDEVASVGEPLSSAADDLFELRAAIDDVDSGWLIPRFADPLEQASEQFDEQSDQLDTAVELLDVLPVLLGADGDRDYFVAFTTPAEARGAGGFMGNYAILRASDGALEMTEFGRTGELNDRVVAGTVLDLPADWGTRWGRYGFTNGPDGTVGSVPWSNVMLSPHFPSTGAVISELWGASGGDPIDGVISMDPYVLEALVEFTGPIDVGVGEPWELRLTTDNTADFLIFDQYLIPETADRVDLLEDVSQEVVTRLLEGSLPNAATLADRFAPLIDAKRLMFWMVDSGEQGFVERVDADAGMPSVAGADAVHVTINNAGANKLDAFLVRDVTYRAEFDPLTAVVRGTIDINLVNNGPSEGLPDGVIGNYVGDPIGTNRMFVSVYTGVRAQRAFIDGEQVGGEPASEVGWNSIMVPVVIPSGEERTLTIETEGQLVVWSDDDPSALAVADRYELVIGTQPLVDDLEYLIDVRTPEGEVLVAVDDVVIGSQRWLLDSDGELLGE